MRAALNAEFTTMEKLVVAMVIRGDTYRVMAQRLVIAKRTVAFHIRGAADKIPSKGLTPQQAIVFWWRGATREQLTTLYAERP